MTTPAPLPRQRRRRALGGALLAACVLVSACANQAEPARKLVGDIEAAVAAAGTDAQKYVPDQVAAVNQQLADLKGALGKQDYQTVLAGAPALVSEARGLVDAAAAKKKEVVEALNAQWTELAAAVPQSVAAIEARLVVLSKARKLPAGLDKAGLAAASSGLDDVRTAWNGATAAFGSGDLEGALARAREVHAHATRLAAQLGIVAGDPAKPAP